jgi:hypothetical protein
VLSHPIKWREASLSAADVETGLFLGAALEGQCYRELHRFESLLLLLAPHIERAPLRTFWVDLIAFGFLVDL